MSGMRIWASLVVFATACYCGAAINSWLLEPSTTVFHDYHLECSRREVGGRRYLYVTTGEGRRFRTLKRVHNCPSLVHAQGPATIVYRDSNSTIYGLSLSGSEVISAAESKTLRRFVALPGAGFLVFYSLICVRAAFATRTQLQEPETLG